MFVAIYAKGAEVHGKDHEGRLCLLRAPGDEVQAQCAAQVYAHKLKVPLFVVGED